MQATIVVGYDQTPHSDAALAVAARETAMRGGRLNVVTAFLERPVPSGSALPPDPDPSDGARKAAEAVAQHGVDQALELYPKLAAASFAVAGSAGKTVARAAHGADLLVVGSRGRGGFDGMQLGSTSMRALADACCPVLVVRGRARGSADGPAEGPARHRIVAAVDIDEPFEPILDFAFDEASRRGARLTVIHVWDEPWIVDYGQEDPAIADDVVLIEQQRRDRLSAAVYAARRRHPDVQPFEQVATGPAARLLVEASRRADLLVTGARRHGEGRHGMQIGPVTQTLLHHSECPVAVVPVD